MRHTYPQGEVLIDIWVVESYSGEPRGLDGQALRGLTQDELDREEAVGVAGARADFLVLRNVLGCGELTSLCDSVRVPVFARGIGLDQPWALGASGCNEIGS